MVERRKCLYPGNYCYQLARPETQRVMSLLRGSERQTLEEAIEFGRNGQTFLAILFAEAELIERAFTYFDLTVSYQEGIQTDCPSLQSRND